MQELEKLLNSFIQRGWKPANFPGKSEIKISEDGDVVLYMNAEDVTLAVKVKLRNLVSLESGLWQFVCENELTHWYNWEEWKYTEIFPWDYRDYPADEHKYRLLESALIPEKELAKFLVDNIKHAKNK